MAETNYFSSRVTDASAVWQEVELVADFNRAFKSIVIINDDDTLELQVKLNETDNDIVYIPGGEGAAFDKDVYRIFYYAASGSPEFRIMAD